MRGRRAKQDGLSNVRKAEAERTLRRLLRSSLLQHDDESVVVTDLDVDWDRLTGQEQTRLAALVGRLRSEHGRNDGAVRERILSAQEVERAAKRVEGDGELGRDFADHIRAEGRVPTVQESEAWAAQRAGRSTITSVGGVRGGIYAPYIRSQPEEVDELKALVEKLCGPVIAAAATQRKLAALAERAKGPKRLPQRRVLAEAGSVELPASVIEDLYSNTIDYEGTEYVRLYAADLALLVVLLAAWDRQEAPNRYCKFVDGVLVVQARQSPMPPNSDPDSQIGARWLSSLERMSEPYGDWFTFKRAGDVWISPGWRLGQWFADRGVIQIPDEAKPVEVAR